VDDGFRVRNSSLFLDLLAPPFCTDDELGGNRLVAAGHMKSDDMNPQLPVVVISLNPSGRWRDFSQVL